MATHGAIALLGQPIVDGANASAVTVPGGYGEYLATSLAVLVGICILAWAVIRFGLPRVVPGAATSPRSLVKVLARVPLEPRQTLYVVEVAGKTLLLGTGDRPMATLAELDGAALAPELEHAPKRSAGFREALARLRSSGSSDMKPTAGLAPGPSSESDPAAAAAPAASPTRKAAS